MERGLPRPVRAASLLSSATSEVNFSPFVTVQLPLFLRKKNYVLCNLRSSTEDPRVAFALVEERREEFSPEAAEDSFPIFLFQLSSQGNPVKDKEWCSQLAMFLDHAGVIAAETFVDEETLQEMKTFG